MYALGLFQLCFSYISCCGPTFFFEVGLFFLRCVSCVRRICSSCHFVSLTLSSCFFVARLVCFFACLCVCLLGPATSMLYYSYLICSVFFSVFLSFFVSFFLSVLPSFLSCLLVCFRLSFFPPLASHFFFFCVCFRKAVLHVLSQAFLLLFSFSFIFLSLFPFLSVASFVFVF